MKKKQKLIFVIIAVVVLGSAIALISSDFLPQSLVFDDYGILDDFETGADPSRWNTNFLESDGKMTFLGGSGIFESKMNLDGTDLKFVVTSSIVNVNVARNTPCNIPPHSVSVGSCSVVNFGSRGKITDSLFNVYISDLNSSYGELWMNGQKQCSFDAQNYQIKFSVSPYGSSCPVHFVVDEVRMKKKFNVAINPDTEALFVQRFIGGQTVTLENFKRPVKAFPQEHGVLITSAVERGIGVSFEPYQVWARNGQVVVPAGEVWQSYFIADKINAPKKCDFAYDLDGSVCVNQVEFVIVCADDQVYDNVKGACVDSLTFSCELLDGVMSGGTCVLPSSVDLTPSNPIEQVLDAPIIQTIDDEKNNPVFIWSSVVILFIIVVLFFAWRRKR